MIASKYIKNHNNYVKEFQIETKSKIRKIVKYQETVDGEKLRKFHNKLLKRLNKFPTSRFSIAYKKGFCTKDALYPHMKSKIFIKLDISNFFDSITREKLLKYCKYAKKINKKSLRTCFYKEHLSLGYITSPRISDMYLYNFDIEVEKYMKDYNHFHYTRYSDDILISSEKDDLIDIYKFYNFIKKKLSDFDLIVNEAKLKEFDIDKHKSVHFLGLNIVLKNGVYDITISKRFIVKTLDLIEKLNTCHKEKLELSNRLTILKNQYKIDNNLDVKEDINKTIENIRKIKLRVRNLKSVIKSRVSYMKYNSITTYNRFVIKHNNRFGTMW